MQSEPDVLLVAAVLVHRLQEIFGFLVGHSALFQDADQRPWVAVRRGANKRERERENTVVRSALVNVIGHLPGIAADVNVRSLLSQEIRHPLPVLGDSVLHVHLLLLLARESGEEHDLALGGEFRQLLLVDEVVLAVAAAEEDQVLAAGGQRGALEDEGAEGREACAGADHDHGRARIRRQTEVGLADKDGDLLSGRQVPQPGRGDALRERGQWRRRRREGGGMEGGT